MTTTLVTDAERQELYQGLARWIAPHVPEIRARLEALGRSDLLESNISLLLVGLVTAMEQTILRVGLEDEVRSRGFLATWDAYAGRPQGSRWFPPANLHINVRRAAPKVAELSPDTKAAIDYLLAGMRANTEAALSNRPDLEVLDGSGKVVSRTRRVKKEAVTAGNRA